MRLQDAIHAAEPLIIETVDQQRHNLPGAAELSAEIAAAPVRYVLDDHAAALVAHTAFSDRNTLIDSLDLVRFPFSTFWVEWNEPARLKALRQAGLLIAEPGPTKKGHAGMLVRAEANGRRGEISVLWENHGHGPDCSPLTIEFDLDDPNFGETPVENTLTRSIRLGNSANFDAIFRHARYRLADPWLDYLRRYSNGPGAFEAAVHTNLKSVAGDFVFAAAFCLVLSARNALRYDASQLKRLNAARSKRGVAPLLDHMTVSLDLGDEQSDTGGFHGQNGRLTSRLHHVCGHMVRRGANLHWRRPHLRGNPQIGMVSSRTIKVMDRASTY